MHYIVVITTNKCTILLLQTTIAQYCYYNKQMHNIVVITTNMCPILLFLQPTNARYFCYYNQQVHNIVVITTNKCTNLNHNIFTLYNVYPFFVFTILLVFIIKTGPEGSRR